MKSRKSKNTIIDVAKAAEVSAMTVSRALHRPELVALKTRAKVLEICEQLNYQPNASARSLRTKRSFQIGVIIPDWRNAFWIDVVSGIEEIITHAGFQLLIANSNEERERLSLQINTMLSRVVDGLLIAPVGDSFALLQNLDHSDHRIVLIDRLPAGLEDLDSVVIDNEVGAYKATLHLLDEGHKCIGLLAGNINLDTGQQRLDGYRRALEERNLAIDNRWVRTAETNAALVGKQVGYAGALEFMEMEERPTALLCTSNTIAIGALMALQELHVKIPDEIAVASFGNMEWTSLINPPLTVVTQPTFEMGRQAARILIDRIDRVQSNEVENITNVTLKPQLIIRESSINR